MKNNSIYIGLGFVAFGLFEMSEGRLDEMLLYLLVGLAFFVTWGSYRPNLSPQWKKALAILSWVIIIAAGVVFYVLVRSGAQG